MNKQEIPNGWRKEKLTELLIFEKGKKPNELYDEPGHNRVKYLIVDSINDNGTKYANKDEGVVCVNEDLLIIADGSRSGYMFTGQNGLVSSTFLIIKPKNNSIHKKFLYYLMNNLGLTGKQFRKGGAIPHFDYNRLKLTIALLPTDKEQDKISNILTAIDDSIEETDKIIDKCLHLKNGIIQTLLLKGIPKRHKKFQETELGDIPEDWKFITLGDVASPTKNSFVDGPFGSDLKVSDYTDEGILLIQLQNIGDGIFYPESDEKYTSEEKYKELFRHAVFPNDIVISKMADPIARCCIVTDYRDRYLAVADCVRLKINETEFDLQYVMALMNSPHVRRIAFSRGTGTTRRRIGLGELRRLPFLKPSLIEQKEISSILSSFDKRIIKETEKKGKLHKLKVSLMQKLLSGEIRVRV